MDRFHVDVVRRLREAAEDLGGVRIGRRLERRDQAGQRRLALEGAHRPVDHLRQPLRVGSRCRPLSPNEPYGAPTEPSGRRFLSWRRR